MASFFGIGSRFGRQNNKVNGQQDTKVPSPTSLSSTSLQAPSIPQLPASPSLNATMPFETPTNTESTSVSANPRLPFFFREENSGLIVKGNFMTLAAKPEHIEKGEWLAHQVVEQYRLLEGMIKIIQEKDANTNMALCNPVTCPTMSAAEFTYTWLDNNRNPVPIPAASYITLVQKWIIAKITDQNLFPIDTTFSGSQTVSPRTIPPNPGNANSMQTSLATRDWVGRASGFPESFESDIMSLYRQMCRCYAHIYHAHWLDPFYHISAYKELNTCFIHFVNVGKLFGLLGEKEMKPMQPLIDIWIAKGLLPLPGAPKPEIMSAPA